ncbi:hypothetical protein ROTAS13_04254 [Roseomonas sp. TAS13]|nr:hypothetical protein ROTAS13_04254 [Roseomonas sp. TAS13]
MPPAPGDQPAPRRAGQVAQGGGLGLHRAGGQGGGAIGVGQARHPVQRGGEGVAVQGFGHGTAEEGVPQEARHDPRIGPAAACQPPALVEAAAGAAEQEVVQHGIGRAGVEGDHRLAIQVGHVADPAQVQHGERPRLPQPRHEGAVVERHQRRPLAARRDIGVAEAVHHRQAQARGGGIAEDELAGEARLRPVQHGLAVQADHGDLLARQAGLGQETLHRRRMGPGDRLFQRRERVAQHPLRLRRQAQQGGAQAGLVGIGTALAGLHQRFAVAAEGGDIDPVYRGAADDPDGGGGGMAGHGRTPEAGIAGSGWRASRGSRRGARYSGLPSGRRSRRPPPARPAPGRRRGCARRTRAQAGSRRAVPPQPAGASCWDSST